MKEKVDEHWNVIPPSHPEEIGKCMKELDFVNEKSCLTETLVNAYRLAHEKKDEGGKTVMLSIFILQKGMSRLKLGNIVGMEVSARKYTGAIFCSLCHGWFNCNKFTFRKKDRTTEKLVEIRKL